MKLYASAADPAALGPRDQHVLEVLAGAAARASVDVATQAGKVLPTLSVDAAVRFASPADRAAFGAALANAVRGLAARYHDDAAPDGRTYRVVVLSHPRPEEAPEHE